MEQSTGAFSAALECGLWAITQNPTQYTVYNRDNPCPQNWFQMWWDFRYVHNVSLRRFRSNCAGINRICADFNKNLVGVSLNEYRNGISCISLDRHAFKPVVYKTN